MYGVGVSATVVSASRGSPRCAKLEIPKDAQEKLDAYCKIMEIDVKKQKPQWWVASMYG